MTEQQTAGNPAPDPRETEQEQAYPQEPEQSALEEERRKKKKIFNGGGYLLQATGLV